MDLKEVTEKLRKQASIDPAFNAVSHMFSERLRARHSVSLNALTQRMTKDGFTFKKSDYERVLGFLASVGLGTYVKSSRGRIIGLRGISYTLKSIGEAAINEKVSLSAIKQRNKFEKLQGRTNTLTAAADIIKPKQPGSGAVAGYPVSITVVINGKPVNFRVPKELNEKEIADLVVRFRDKETEL